MHDGAVAEGPAAAPVTSSEAFAQMLKGLSPAQRTARTAELRRLQVRRCDTSHAVLMLLCHAHRTPTGWARHRRCAQASWRLENGLVSLRRQPPDAVAVSTRRSRQALSGECKTTAELCGG